jgi:signal transduction histidine kinase
VPLLVFAAIRARGDRQLARRSVIVFCLVTLGAAQGILILAGTAPATIGHPHFWLIVEALAVAVWVTLAVQSCARDRLAGARPFGWVTLALMLMAVADGMRAWSMSDTYAIVALGLGFQLVAALIVTARAAVELLAAVRHDGADYGELTRELVSTQRRLSEVERRQRQRLHDARSAVLGVAGASALLTGPAPSGPFDAGSLRSLMTGELNRLEQLLRLEDDEPVVEFDLAQAAAAVVLARRLDGLIVDVDLAGVRVVGHPRATATVLDNLLRNAHQHARGGRVRLAASTFGHQATITVCDDGPGIPAAERGGVLQPGIRGSGAHGTGSGFGLYSAARAMSAQSGSLTLSSAERGGTEIVLRMPAAAPLHAVAS